MAMVVIGCLGVGLGACWVLVCWLECVALLRLLISPEYPHAWEGKQGSVTESGGWHVREWVSRAGGMTSRMVREESRGWQ